MNTLRPTHIAETSLYVEDLDRAAAFFIGLFGLEVLRRDDRFCALRIAEEQVLLLFRRGTSLRHTLLSGGSVPPHDGTGQLHVCFGVPSDEIAPWEARLKERGIPLESRVDWPGGAISLYFRDPDNHAIELATPGLWRGLSTTP